MDDSSDEDDETSDESDSDVDVESVVESCAPAHRSRNGMARLFAASFDPV